MTLEMDTTLEALEMEHQQLDQAVAELNEAMQLPLSATRQRQIEQAHRKLEAFHG